MAAPGFPPLRIMPELPAPEPQGQLSMVPLLDRGVECVRVDMDDLPLPHGHCLGALTCRGAADRLLIGACVGQCPTIRTREAPHPASHHGLQ